MLASFTDFPNTGCIAYLRGTAQQARIQQRNHDGTVLISIADHRFSTERASGTRTVEMADLAETPEDALAAATVQASPKPRRKRRAVAHV